MTISRDTWLAVGLLLLLVVVVAVTAVAQSRPTYPPLSSLSAAPDGAKALRLWLNELGYVTHARAVAAFEAPAGSSLALVLEPSQPVSGADLRALDRFLDAGGTLVAAGSRSEAQTLARHFDFELNSLAEATTVRALQAPLLASPPPAQVAVRTAAYLQSERGDFVTHLAVPEGPVLVSFAQGEGRVFLSATAMPFANASLKADGNGALVLSMVSAATRRGVVWFDECIMACNWPRLSRWALPSG